MQRVDFCVRVSVRVLIRDWDATRIRYRLDLVDAVWRW